MTTIKQAHNEAIQHLGRRLSWKAIPFGLPVRIFSHGSYVGCGTVDSATPDGSTLWVRLEGVEGRRMFHRADDIILEAYWSKTTSDLSGLISAETTNSRGSHSLRT